MSWLGWLRAFALSGVLACGACRSASSQEASAREPATAPPPPDPEQDEPYEQCRARIGELLSRPDLPGSPGFEQKRAEVLGRARGEPMLFTREPRATPEDELPAPARGLSASLQARGALARIRALRTRFAGDRPSLRALLLREGYLYSPDPHEALALVTLLDLPKLFDQPTLFLQRGAEVFELRRVDGKQPRYVVVEDGARPARSAELLFGDRVAVRREQLASPLHRDLRGAARQYGFDRARIVHRAEHGLVAELRFGGAWIRTLLSAEGARLELECLDATASQRKRIEAWRAEDAARRRALAQLRSAIDLQLDEALPFDRPRDEETAERDGQLRPVWRWAYRNGQSFFSFDQRTYPVYDAHGRPQPPQVCVDFVLDSFERASGTWFAPREAGPTRAAGALDFDLHGITNRRGVLAFEKFAQENPALFEHRRFEPAERIQFRERERFFGFLRENADLFRPGDVVAIQGRKSDGLIHQHAILIEDTDPVTGFPDALADQMKRPRRRTWEGIMAEAPLRSLLFRVRPKPSVIEKLDRGG
jgi:hypothetical protein